MRIEDDPNCAETDRTSAQRKDPAIGGLAEEDSSSVDFKRVQSVDKDVRFVKKVLGVACVYVLAENADIAIWVDIMNDLCENIDLRSPESRASRAILAIHVGDVENVWIGNCKTLDTEPSKGDTVNATDTPKSCYGNTAITQSLLLLRADQTAIPNERLVVRPANPIGGGRDGRERNRRGHHVGKQWKSEIGGHGCGSLCLWYPSPQWWWTFVILPK